MIAPGAHLRVERLPLAHVVVTMHQARHLSRVMEYLTALRTWPTHDVLVQVQPLDADGTRYGLLDGHHRYLACVAAGRADILAVIVTEPGQPGYAESEP